MASAGCLGALGHKGTRPGKIQYFGDFNCEIRLRSPAPNASVHPFEPISGEVVINTKREISCAGVRVQLDAIVNVSLNKRSDGGGGARGMHRKMAGLFKDCSDGHEGFYIKSPIDQELIVAEQCTSPLGGLEYKVVIQPGVYTYPFKLSMHDEPMPRQFCAQNGVLRYKVVAYMFYARGLMSVPVPIGEKPVKFKGYYNLSTTPIPQGIHLEKTFSRSMFSSKKVVTVTVTVSESGFLPGEEIPFTMRINNPKRYSVLRIVGNLLTRVTYNVNGITTTTLATLDTEEIDVAAGIGKDEVEIWKSRFSIPRTCAPTFKKSGMEIYTVIHLIQFQLEVDGYSAPLKCQTEVIIGTTRESINDLMIRGQQVSSDLGGTLVRSDSASSSLSDTPSIASAVTLNSLPPNYSQLTSRASSMYSIETLPPNFEDLKL